MANKPGKKETAPRSIVSVYKREDFVVPKKSATRTKTVSKKPSSAVKTKPSPSKTKSPIIALVADKPVAKKRPAKTVLIKSIYQGHTFASDEIVREADLQRTRRKPNVTRPAESVPEVVSLDKPVTLPSAINERLLAKQRALNDWYQNVFPRRVGRLMSVAGFMFMIAGALGLVPFVKSAYPNWPAFQKALVCEFSWCADTSTTVSPTLQSANVVSAQTPKAAVSFLTSPDTVISATTTMVVRAEYVADVQIFAERLDGGETWPLAISGAPTGSDYTVAIAPASLPDGHYRVRVIAKAARDLTKVWFTGPGFEITAGADATEIATSDIVDNSGTAEPESTSTPETIEESGAVETPVMDVTRVAEGFDFVTSSGQLLATISAPEATLIEVSADQINATESLFLGSARRTSDDGWTFEYDLKDLPRGTYELVASAYVGTRPQDEKRVRFEHITKQSVVGPTSTQAVADTAEAIERLRGETSGFPDRTQYLDTLMAELDLSAEIEQLLLSEESELNDLFLRYASIMHSNNEALYALASRSLDEKFDSIAAQSVLGFDSTQTYSTRREELARAWSLIQVKIEGYEQRLSERSGRSSLSDADRDGLSDYDEYYHFKTNIFSADSDTDGVTDSVEVVRGYDPTSHLAETLVAYRSPTESGMVLPEVLAISGVLPVVETDNTRGVPAVMTEITGKAPPHSLVTIFLANDALFTMTRADENGAFIYQLDKTIPDGDHTVYAALLENSGEIVVKSEPFAFSKSHETFLVKREDAVASVINAGLWMPTTSDLANIIIALCVMVLGLGSLLVGYRLSRARESEAVTGAKATLDVTAPAQIG